jgi:hypothetical protein
MDKLLLNNSKNYKNQLEDNLGNIISKYILIIKEYLILCGEAIYMKNENYYKYILKKGVNTLEHIFLMLLLYTKNLELTCHHCQKSAYYYIEFIGQIGDDNHTCLQLNSKDACLFVYKKTIFEIEQNYRKEFSLESPDIKLSSVEQIIKMYNFNINLIIQNTNFLSMTSNETNNMKIDEFIEVVENELNKHVINLSSISASYIELNNKCKLVKYFSEALQINDNMRGQYLDHFIKKIKKNNITFEILKERLSNITTDSNHLSSPQKFVNHLFI